MNCPTDGTTLLMSERQGVEIDYCPQCRGIWLDRGELDKLLNAVDRADDREDDDRRDRDRDRYRDEDRGGPGDRPRKKKRSFLSEMFEFGGD
ncbi:MAG: zf-TFIIB domain-containing protein [Acidimicrobiales bacterium]